MQARAESLAAKLNIPSIRHVPCEGTKKSEEGQKGREGREMRKPRTHNLVSYVLFVFSGISLPFFAIFWPPESFGLQAKSGDQMESKRQPRKRRQALCLSDHWVNWFTVPVVTKLRLNHALLSDNPEHTACGRMPVKQIGTLVQRTGQHFLERLRIFGCKFYR